MTNHVGDDWDAHWGDYADSARDNPAQAYRRRRIFAHLGNVGIPMRIVDIGCGQGDLLQELAGTYPDSDLLGLELSQNGIDVARRKVPRAAFVQRNLLDPDMSAGNHISWGTHAVCSEVLEHVDDPVRLLEAARKYLAPGAAVVITVPGGPRSAFDRHIGHRQHFDTVGLRSLLVRAGLEVEGIEAAGFPVFNLYKLLVIVRGKRLIADAAASASRTSWAAKAAMRIFDRLFILARSHSRFGWQLVAVARVPPHLPQR